MRLRFGLELHASPVGNHWLPLHMYSMLFSHFIAPSEQGGAGHTWPLFTQALPEQTFL
jgi:hypothetical protein